MLGSMSLPVFIELLSLTLWTLHNNVQPGAPQTQANLAGESKYFHPWSMTRVKCLPLLTWCQPGDGRDPRRLRCGARRIFRAPTRIICRSGLALDQSKRRRGWESRLRVGPGSGRELGDSEATAEIRAAALRSVTDFSRTYANNLSERSPGFRPPQATVGCGKPGLRVGLGSVSDLGASPSKAEASITIGRQAGLASCKRTFVRLPKSIC
jgi:hypothetical protein